jgi:HPt (histidine-containing phosphotransfer) domain-containing protein
MSTKQKCNCCNDTPFNLDELTARCLGRIDLVDRVLVQFQESLDQDLEQLDQAMANEDVAGIARVAHRVKGTSLTVAAHRLKDCAEELEESAAAKELERIDESLREFKQECWRVCDSISKR